MPPKKGKKKGAKKKVKKEKKDDDEEKKEEQDLKVKLPTYGWIKVKVSTASPMFLIVLFSFAVTIMQFADAGVQLLLCLLTDEPVDAPGAQEDR